MTAVSTVGEADLGELLPLVRGYADFYEVSPSDEALMQLSRTLIADPEREGMQFLARDGEGRAIGFATVYWLWSTTSATRIGLMNDLYVAPEGRGSGAAEALIERCRAACCERGASKLTWQTAKDNARAQAVYDRIGGERQEWLDYSLKA
ncbi:MAG TPA: GNAT family N-acetyltransferase [Solirubrobacteraceae bacterium]|nr:GNAT family N-acetyltransferase [Solirubrobacteraceae bacterium]